MLLYWALHASSTHPKHGTALVRDQHILQVHTYHEAQQLTYIQSLL